MSIKRHISFQKAYDNGEPLIHEGVHKTVANPYFGIEGGVTFKILWIYSERSMSFENKLSGPLREELRIGQRGRLKASRLKNFPNFATFVENRLRVTDMFPEQVNLLANYQTWIVKEDEARIRQSLSG